ncbi:hypothetical protein OnM2_073034 [Erysiphe neolycopersici]|uniref:Uncharacterized protein n=1 Tax=Erysiphe neolycopersici TaxID=212602 RepID=A0A420HJC0_9PEZI|nr:hypothetical protein OnM2_073034 [Erysiphe neolycopersici]
MIKINNIERTSRLQTIKAPWLIVCSLSLIIGSLIGTQILVPFGLSRASFHSSSYPNLESLPGTRLKEIKTSSKEDAEKLIIDSLVLFQELLIKISDGKDYYALICLLQLTFDVGDSTSAISKKNAKNQLVARGIASDISNFFSGGAGGGGGGGGIAKSLAGGFSGLLGKLGFGNLTESLSAGAADASKYLGIGLGNGTITGLDLPPKYVKTSKVTQEKPTGINLIASNIGQGLTSSLVGSIDLKSVTPDPSSLGSTAKAVGEGVGNGAAAGLNLKPANSVVSNNGTGITAIAGNFVQGLTSSLLGNIDLKSVMSMGNLSSDDINSAAYALAQGLGGGAAYAVKLSPNPPSNTTFGQSRISGISGNLGQGLSTSFLKDINFKELLTSNAPTLSPDKIADAAKGLGAGLAGGAVVGIGLQPESSGSNVQLTPGGLGQMTESFGRGLSQSFLTNGTIMKLLATAKPAGQLDIGSVAKGLAIGLVDGATTSFDNAGGIKAIFNMEPGTTPEVKTLTKSTTYNDSVGGAATGFGNGLGLQTTTFVLQLFGKPPLNQAPSDPSMMTLGAPGSGQPLSGTPVNGQPSSGTPQPSNGAIAVGLRRRQTTTIAPANPSDQGKFGSLDVLDIPQFNGTITPIVQTAIDTLKCQGIGGLASILFSVGSSRGTSTSSVDIKDLRDKISRLGFSKQTINIKDKESGNTYDINIAELKIKINGNGLTKQIVVLVSHIILAIVVFAIVIPIIFIIGSIRNFAVISGRSDVLKNPRKIQWILALVIVLPVTFIVFITGMVAEGVKKHFTSFHGIAGLVLLLIILAAFPLAYLAAQDKLKLVFSIIVGLILQLILVVLITGFVDLSSLVFCATQIIPQPIFMLLGIFLTAPLLLAAVLLTLNLLLERWRGSAKNSDRLSNLFLSGRSSVAAEKGFGEKPPTLPMVNRSEGEKSFFSA